ncbi:MAG: hypothetical protein WCD16_07450, partial [Paracoccaceae bacterium]
LLPFVKQREDGVDFPDVASGRVFPSGYPGKVARLPHLVDEMRAAMAHRQMKAHPKPVPKAKLSVDQVTGPVRDFPAAKHIVQPSPFASLDKDSP